MAGLVSISVAGSRESRRESTHRWEVQAGADDGAHPVRPAGSPSEDEERDRNERSRHDAELEPDLGRRIRVLCETRLHMPALVQDVEGELQKRRPTEQSVFVVAFVARASEVAALTVTLADTTKARKGRPLIPRLKPYSSPKQIGRASKPVGARARVQSDLARQERLERSSLQR